MAQPLGAQRSLIWVSRRFSAHAAPPARRPHDREANRGAPPGATVEGDRDASVDEPLAGPEAVTKDGEHLAILGQHLRHYPPDPVLAGEPDELDEQLSAQTEPVNGVRYLDRDLSVGCAALTGHRVTENLVFAVGGDQPNVSLAIRVRGVSSCSGEIAGGGEEPQPAIFGAQVVEQNLQTLLVVRVDEVQEDTLAIAEDQPTGRRDSTGDVDHWFIRISCAVPGVVPTVARETRQCGGPLGSSSSPLHGG